MELRLEQEGVVEGVVALTAAAEGVAASATAAGTGAVAEGEAGSGEGAVATRSKPGVYKVVCLKIFAEFANFAIF